MGYFGVKGGLFTVLTGGAFRVWGPTGSFIADNNQLALALITILPFVLYLATVSTGRWFRLGIYSAAVLIFFSVIGSQSRGALVGLVAMGGVLVLRSPNKAPVIAITILLALVGVWFVPESWVERMNTITEYQTDSSALSRIEAWTFAVKLALDNPITGGGFHVSSMHSLFLSYVPEAPHGRSFHSIWFEMLGAHGFVGLAIFIVMLSLSWFNCSSIRKRTRDRPELRWAFNLASMTQVSLAGYMAAGTFLNLAFFDLLYTIIAIIIGTRVVVERELSGQTDMLRHGAKRRIRSAPGPRLAETTATRAQKPVRS